MASERLGVTGLSRGGELALLLGTTFPQKVGAIVGLVPSGVVMPGFGSDPSASTRSAWSYEGSPLPFVPVDVSRLGDQEEGSTALRLLRLDALRPRGGGTGSHPG